MASARIALAQMNPVVGDIDGNTDKLVSMLERARNEGADIVVFPELVLTGYPPEDLLLRPSLELRIERALKRIEQASQGICVVLGFPAVRAGGLFNAAAVFEDRRLLLEYHKHVLPNYQVFDEMRYFTKGDDPAVFEWRGHNIAVSICEDIWHEGPMAMARAAGARLMLNINASPYHIGKQQEREHNLSQRVQQGDMPIAYVNMVGGQDELVFDGGSCVMSAEGEICYRADDSSEQLLLTDWTCKEDLWVPALGHREPLASELASMYQQLVTGVKDYVNKNGFRGVVLGLSGGIDSALTLAIAVDALGADRVEAVMMPFRYTSSMSLEDAEQEAKTLGVGYRVLSIEPIYDAFMATLSESFEGTEVDTTEQNIQARARGVLLMALSNKKGYLVLTTGNKSEMAVGYSTLYGDMAGGFDVLKDVSKARVFALSRYRNEVSPVIPQRVIDRPPSAELAPDQKDEDNLPPYEVLDQILELYVEKDESAEAIIARGFEREDVLRVIRLVDINEYKRRQAPIGTRITLRGFGRDRRYPITNRWTMGD